jgi:hypothetical protein
MKKYHVYTNGFSEERLKETLDFLDGYAHSASVLMNPPGTFVVFINESTINALKKDDLLKDCRIVEITQ